MNIDKLIVRLEAMQQTLPGLIAGVTNEDARWKPSEKDWSVLEIVRHLVDEETDDFRQRVQLTFTDPTTAWPAIDPEQAAIDRDYNNGSLQDALADFQRERAASVVWLKDNATEILRRINNTYQHPKWGPFQLGDICAAWVAHDQLHIRQLAKRHFQIVQRDAQGFSIRYAGDW